MCNIHNNVLAIDKRRNCAQETCSYHFGEAVKYVVGQHTFFACTETYTSMYQVMVFKILVIALTKAGPIRLFVPYKRRKRESSTSGSPILKKSLSLSSENSRREGNVHHNK